MTMRSLDNALYRIRKERKKTEPVQSDDRGNKG